MASASTMPGARRYSPTNTNRSKVRKTDLFGDLRRSTLICCRRTRISASSRALEQNKLVSAVHSSMRRSTITRFAPARQPDEASDKDRVFRACTRVNSPISHRPRQEVLDQPGPVAGAERQDLVIEIIGGVMQPRPRAVSAIADPDIGARTRLQHEGEVLRAHGGRE